MTEEPTRQEESPHASTSSTIPPFCVACGYILTGSVSPQCPECGEFFVAREWRRKAEDYRRLAVQTKEANEWANYGLKAVLVAAFLLLFAVVLRGSLLSPLAHIGAALIGVFFLFMGIGVARCGKLPTCAREAMNVSPNYMLGACSAVLGLVVLLIAIYLG